MKSLIRLLLVLIPLVLIQLTSNCQPKAEPLTDYLYVEEHGQLMMRANHPWMKNVLRVIKEGKRNKELLVKTQQHYDSCLVISKQLSVAYDSLTVAYNQKNIQVGIKEEELVLETLEKDALRKELRKKNVGFWVVTGAAILELITIITVSIR